MKYTPKQYASALLRVMIGKEGSERKKIIQNFLSLLRKNGDQGRLGFILREVEKQYFRKTGIKKVLLESMEGVELGLKKEIEAILGKNLFFQEKINPHILAGIKILVNDEVLIDASGNTRLNKLFKHG